MVQVFRRHQSVYDSAHLKLLGFNSEASYLVITPDTGAQQRHGGRALLRRRARRDTADQPDVAVLS